MTFLLDLFLLFFFLLFATDQNIRLYDTTRGRFHLRQTVKARDVGWSVLDVCFTPDTQHVLYSSWSDYSKAAGPVRYRASHYCVVAWTASHSPRTMLPTFDSQ